MLGTIILAAGLSRRFGNDKRKAVLPGGDSVLVRTINNVAGLTDSTLVVLRAGEQRYAEELAQQIDAPGVSYLLAPDSAQGMAHSLGNAITQVAELSAVIVFLADMPYVAGNTVAALIAAYEANRGAEPIVVPRLNGTAGHPVIFDQCYFTEIAALAGDRGARAVIDAHADKLITVDVSDPGILKDIDTPADL